MIGDNLKTDIQFAVNNQIDSLLVLSGNTSEDEFWNSELKPTYV